MRICKKCQIEQPDTEFYARKRAKDGLSRQCRTCANMWQRAYRHGNGKLERRSSTRKNKIGISVSVQEEEDMLIKQNWRCAICLQVLDRGRNTHVDHNHKTMQIRGLLCNECNMALGKFKDDPELVKKALEYLYHYDKLGEQAIPS